MKTLRLAVLGALISAVFVLVATVFIVLADRAGLLNSILPASSAKLPSDLSQIGEVYSILQSNYVEPERMNAKDLSEGAIRGMLDALNDPYTDFIPSDAYSVRTEDLQGQFGGIGAVVSSEEGQIAILRVLPGTPAEEAGLKKGDVVLEVNGASVQGKTVTDVVTLIRGKEGTTVRVRVRSNGQERDIEFTRRIVTVSSVLMSTVDGVPYMQITTFSQDTGKDVEAALKTIDLGDVPGIVVDLRGDTGGLLDAVVTAAGHFLDKDKVILYQRDRQGNETERKTSGRGLAAEVPLVILVDRYTASASEIFAGAMQDHENGILIGERTYGKGSVGLLFNLSGGAGLTVTSARWLTPNHRLIEGNGLDPNIALLDDRTTREVDEALQRAIQEVKAKSVLTAAYSPTG